MAPVARREPERKVSLQALSRNSPWPRDSSMFSLLGSRLEGNVESSGVFLLHVILRSEVLFLHCYGLCCLMMYIANIGTLLEWPGEAPT